MTRRMREYHGYIDSGGRVGCREWSEVPRGVHERGWSPSAEYAGDIDGR